MTERSELGAIKSSVTPGQKCRSPRKVAFPTEDWNECYNPSAANVSLRKKSSFNPSKLADIEEAKKHQRATRVAKIPTIDSTSQVSRCSCCQYPIETEDFSLLCDVDELGQLGSAFPLYYYFLKYLLVILLIATLVSAVPCVIGNYRADRASMWKESDQSDQSSYVYLSIGNYGDPFDSSIDRAENYIPMWQALLHLVTILLILATYPLFKYYQSRKGIEVDLQSSDPALYTVRVTGLGLDWNEEDVTQFFEQHGRWDGKPAKVVLLTPVYHIAEYLGLCEKLTYWETRYEYVKKFYKREKRLPREKVYVFLKRQMENEEVCLKEMEAAREKVMTFEKVSSIGKRTGTAFISFQTPMDARMVARRFSSSLLFYILLRLGSTLGFKSHRRFGSRLLTAGMAPQPADIFWENLDVSTSKHLQLKMKTAALAICVLFLTFGVLLGLSYWKRLLSSESKSSDGAPLALQIAPFLPSIFIMITNVVLEQIMRKLASYEQHYSWTTYCKSVSEKLIIAEALNTCFLPFLVNLPPKERWFMPGGLIDDIFLQIITMSVLCPLQYFFNFSWAVKAYRRRKLCKVIPAGKSSLSQLACNRTFENTEIDVPSRYVRLGNQLILAFVYAPAIPLGIPITLVGFLVEYAVDKYMLLRFHCRPKAQNSMLAEHITKVVPIAMSLYALGAVVFYTVLRAEKTYECVIIMILTTVLFYLMPISVVFQGMMKAHPTDVVEEMLSELEKESYKYERKAPALLTDYKRENPVTADSGFKEWLTLIVHNAPSSAESQLANELLQVSPDLSLQEKMLNYNSRHQNLPTVAKFLFSSNSDSRDEMLGPAQYASDRMERIRFVIAKISPIKPLEAVLAPIDEVPDIDMPEEVVEQPTPPFNPGNLKFFQSPYGIRTTDVLSPATMKHVSSVPLLRHLTTIMDAAIAPEESEDGELPVFPFSSIQNRRDLKIPYEPEHRDPYNFDIHSNAPH